MQLVPSRIWTRVAVSISYEDNHYTTGTWNQLTVITLITFQSLRLPVFFGYLSLYVSFREFLIIIIIIIIMIINYLTHTLDPHRNHQFESVDLELMARKEYFTLIRSPELEPHHQKQVTVSARTPPILEIGRVLALRRIYSWHILSLADMVLNRSWVSSGKCLK